MPLELSLVFLLGLVSSLHCVQMCGPIVLAFSLPLKRSMLCVPTCTQCGRILTYTLLSDRRAAGGGIGMLGRMGAGTRASFGGSAMIVGGT
jgi:sulfite exporter TauE/SafE